MKILITLLFAVSVAQAADVQLNDYQWSVTDVLSKGLNKESLFTSMDRKFIKTNSSVCSNRAHMWANNFEKQHDLDTAKIFLFYTKKKGGASLRTWWYHVAPVINEGGNLFVMDAGFYGWIKGPMTKEEWLKQFTNSTNCKEIQSHETDLVQMINSSRVFPSETRYGNFDCYYKITPHTIWTPEFVAKSLLGKDSEGKPVHVDISQINKAQLYQACIEATASALGRVTGASAPACREYVGY